MFLKLIRQRGLRFEDREHFYSLSARIMRRVLIDHARSQHREKRDGGVAVPLREELTNTRTEQLTFATPTVTTPTATAFSTEIVGKYHGTTVYDQTFAAAYGTATVQAGVTAADAAVAAGGISSNNYQVTLSTYTIGARYMPPIRKTSLRPFADALVGVAHTGGSLVQGTIVANAGASFALNVGGRSGCQS